ncbi:MAG: PilW family protein, partial [Pseudomonadales bacterium]
VANSETYNMLQGQSRMQESARFALNFLGRGIQMAGYKGCFSQNEEVYSVANNPDGIPYEFDVRSGMFAYEGFGGGGGWSPAINEDGLTTLPDTVNDDWFESAVVTENSGVPIDQVIPGTDVLTLRRTSSTEYQLAEDHSDPTEPVDVETGDPAFDVGDMVLIHDCEKSTIFRITDLTIDAGAEVTTIGHSIGGTEPFDNDRETLPEVNRFEVDAAVSPIETHIYYIAPGAGINNQDESPLSLWRKSNRGAPVELVEGVENFKLLFGEDTNEDGVPNVYSTASGISDYGDVVTVRISITVNSIDDVGGTSEPTHGCISDGGEQPCIDGELRDGLIRRTFHETIQVRNRG